MTEVRPTDSQPRYIRLHDPIVHQKVDAVLSFSVEVDLSQHPELASMVVKLLGVDRGLPRTRLTSAYGGQLESVLYAAQETVQKSCEDILQRYHARFGGKLEGFAHLSKADLRFDIPIDEAVPFVDIAINE